MAKKKESEFDKLARLIKEEGEDIRAELGGRIDSLAKEVRSGFARVDPELRDIRAELRSIRADIASLQERFGHHAGFSKEIDHVLARVAAIEKHIKQTASK